MELPPIKEPKHEDKPAQPEPDQGISKGLKTTIIAFTVFTILAFIVFTFLMVGKLSSPKNNNEEWNVQLLAVAEKLKDAGLHEQAIEQYEKYLQDRKVDMVVRGEVSRTLGNLFMDLGNCREALSWFYQAEAAFPKAPWIEELNARIDGCLHRLNLPQ